MDQMLMVTSTLQKLLEKEVEGSPTRKSIAEVVARGLSGLARVPKGRERAQVVHHTIDVEMEKAKDSQAISCKERCSHCCTIYVTITEDEADLLLKHSVERKIHVDLDKLKKQECWKVEDYWKAPLEDSTCVFLGDDKRCKVYEVRPAACRLYQVRSDPKLCERGPGGESCKVEVCAATKGELAATIGLNVEFCTLKDDVVTLKIFEKNMSMPAQLIRRLGTAY